ncbi:hypothetical protein CFC21_004221 [Triticum aestivum]|uniref:Phytocyanin domain-containing protein n=2 Tax=Triticum TaxID=4564 RepID=A0A9R0QEY1_TRITD|nr:cucumber peeling cupredoxin-like [Triticum dicoccoides]XP_044450407.1 cucumber peeling cupredoxin-like [Triticum aestivum]KAF6986472.1 hypothetical protein CFC21_004221 [Triticum aestivum]VAH10227.1 unnamed protein product [Triticum turgidum subsp. durum]
MERSKGCLSLLLLAAVVASLVAGSSAGIYHIVGAGKGWQMAPNRTYYGEWARTRNISVGDKLMFLYRSGVYNIVEVPSRDLFDGCSMRNITNRYQNGPTIIELIPPAGPRYYFCGVGKHCEEGQKLKIYVAPFAPSRTQNDDQAEEPDDDGDVISGSPAPAAVPLLALAACLLALSLLLLM